VHLVKFLSLMCVVIVYQCNNCSGVINAGKLLAYYSLLCIK